MAKEKINLREELRLYKFDFDLLQKIPCSKQENKKYQKLLKEGGVLPEGVFVFPIFAVIIAVPSRTAVTLPFLSTVTILSSDELQIAT